MKVIIAGSRDFDDYELLRKYCDHVLQNQTEIEIVSGTARGADQLGERYAKERGYPVKQFPADWDKHGRSAGYIRNEKMAKYGDALIAFWNGNSKGTEHMINLAKQYNLKIRICNYTI
jgi:hypothetical protein